MIKYSKPLDRLLDFKGDYFLSSSSELEKILKIVNSYRSQPRRLICKNCEYPINSSKEKCFTKLGVEYSFCQRCSHCNGAYQDTEFFCHSLYTGLYSIDYVKQYSPIDTEQYWKRVNQIYIPKAQFLRESLTEIGESFDGLADFGAGAGYFLAAAQKCGFTNVIGYDPSQHMVNIGNSFIKGDVLIRHNLNDIVNLIVKNKRKIATFIGVIEHLINPRDALKALSRNPSIKYIFFSVPLFSPTVVFESIFDDVVPRHLVGGHTHLYTEKSIQFFCEEFGFERLSEWWFGLDITDLYRSVLVSLNKSQHDVAALKPYWVDKFMPLIDQLQEVLDKAHVCSEVHILLGKKEN
jgi:hypothetical protein